jgi:hypothetical protein
MKPTTTAEMLSLIYGNGQNNPATIVFYEDPGHGWLQVPISLAKQLGIEANISGFSYMDSKYYYLEEDCDFTALTNGLGLCYEADPKLYRMFVDLIPREWTNNSSPIRSKKNYQYTAPKVSIINQLSMF